MKEQLFLGLKMTSLNLDGDILPNADAINMIQRFRKDNAGDPNKTYAVLFTKEDLDKINALVNNPLLDANGVGLFFAKYPADDSLNPDGHDYSNRPTIVIIPTKDNEPIIDINTPAEPTATGKAYDHGELNP